MRKTGPKRPKYDLTLHDLTIDVSVEEFANAVFDILAREPKEARHMKELADARGTTFDVLVHEAIGLAYHLQGKPMPPELREYLAKHDADMPDAIRQSILRLGLN